MRIGHGYDAHRFAKEPESDGFITLGGVQIPYPYPLLAHSDGDVLVHALCDAILGALALGDIGRHFPDTDARYHDINSLDLLDQVVHKMREQQYQLHNADMTIIAQAPKMAPYLDRMRDILSQHCHLPLDCLNIKATTTEKMGFTGRKEGIAAHVVILLQSC